MLENGEIGIILGYDITCKPDWWFQNKKKVLVDQDEWEHISVGDPVWMGANFYNPESAWWIEDYLIHKDCRIIRTVNLTTIDRLTADGRDWIFVAEDGLDHNVALIKALAIVR